MTNSTWVELTSSLSSADIIGFVAMVQVPSTSAQGFSLDIGIGASGSEVIIDKIVNGVARGSSYGPSFVRSPVAIPAAKRIAARITGAGYVSLLGVRR